MHATMTKHSPLLRLLAAAAVQLGVAANASAALSAAANHDHITVDFMYRGSTVGVKGEADAGTDLIIKITAPESAQTMMKKGKVAGLLWMNVGALHFERAPNLYEVWSTRDLAEILGAGERTENVIGYEALLKHVAIEPTQGEEEKAKWFGEFVKMKEASKLYAAPARRIETQDVGGGRQKYALKTDWPYQAPPGEYTVTVYAVKDGKVAERTECKVRVEQVGVVKALASMARDRAAFYGIVSIAVALGAGFGVGLIAKKGGGAH